MKQIMCFVLCILALPALCIAGKFDRDDVQFDLTATTTTSCNGEISIRGYIYIETGLANGGFDKGVSGATVTIRGEQNRYQSQTETDGNGRYRFCNLKEGNYGLSAYKEGLGSGKFRLAIRDDVSYTPAGFPADIYLWGATPNDEGSIHGKIIGDYVSRIKVKIRGLKKNHRAKYTTSSDGSFEFNNLKKDTYLFFARKGKKRVEDTIELDRNMTYYFYIDWQ